MARITLPYVPAPPGARFVVTNRAGAGGRVGFEALFDAGPDGHTLGALAVPAISTFPLERQVRYRPLDFSFLGNVVDDPNTIYVAAHHRSQPAGPDPGLQGEAGADELRHDRRRIG